MKVLYIVSTLERCGPINVLYNIIKMMDRKNFEPIILTLSNEKTNSRENDFERLGVKIHSFNFNGIMPVLLKGNYLKRYIDKIAPDVIHSHGIRGDLFTAVFLKVYNSVSTIHNYPYEDYVMAYKKILGNIMAFINLYAFRKINNPIACSSTVSNKIKSKTRFDYKYIQNGIDIDEFPFRGEDQKNKIRKELNIPPEKKVFLFLGALISRKNPLMVIESFKKINKDLDCILLIVGDGELYKDCKEVIGNDENIKLVGKVDNPIDYYTAADIYIASSSSEGLPMAVMEAMSTGLPVILSNIDSHREVLNFNKEAGMLFEYNDKGDLVQKMEQIIRMKYEDISIAARNVVIENLSAKGMAIKYQKVYEQNFEI